MSHTKPFKVLRVPGDNGEWIDMHCGETREDGSRQIFVQTSGYVAINSEDFTDAIADVLLENG